MGLFTQGGDTVQIVAIAVICGFIGFGVKHVGGENEKVTRWIPVIVGAVGGLLGLAYRFISPEYAAQVDVLTAIASGIASGLASTGAHQIYKQGKAGNEPDYTLLEDDDDTHV